MAPKKTKTTTAHIPQDGPSALDKQPIFFFKEDDRTLGFLCQWYRCYFVYEGQRFNCTEQWMMWHKAKLSGDEVAAKEIMSTSSPRKQKQLGKEVVNFDEEFWDQKKLEVVEQGNYLKFTQCNDTASIPIESNRNPRPLEELLLETYDRELVEASRFDRVWGIGFDATAAVRTPREKWGQNLLGKALMNVRQKIRQEQQTEKIDGEGKETGA